MADWKHQYPSVTLSRQHDQSNAYADLFRGEGNKLLYELKNLMKFRNLGQLKMTRLFTDGTVITAWSVFGQDFINIDVSRSIIEIAPDALPSCTITFIEFPDAVPPMKNPLQVKSTDVVGVDYFKTYYTVEVKNCPNCQDISWEFMFTYTEPEESRHYTNPITDEEELDNHTIQSLYPPAWAELIEQGRDAIGNYIIWKAYTESGDEKDYSRTGLGIMLVKAIIKDEKMVDLCTQQRKIDVDCCLKDPDLRRTEIWWEDFGTCQPFIMYKGVLYNALCKMPTSIPLWGTAGLNWYACTHPQQPLYAIPEILGTCIPVEWKLTGPIDFWNSKKNDNIIFIKCLDAGCNDGGSITLTDRCGGTYEIEITSCCEGEKAALSISYTSLLMSCGQQQDFTAIGGCGPYSWSLTGGGGSLSNDTGSYTTYTAPATNPNCTSNPTIEVTDCCGMTAEIRLAVNCYTSNAALEMSEVFSCGCLACNAPPCDYCSPPCRAHQRQYRVRKWSCEGTITFDCRPGGGADCSGYKTIFCKPDCTCDDSYSMGCVTAECGGHTPCSTLNDMRTAGMKSGGCCPLNPITGLPY